ncbi:amino acid adenylation domain-containing protein [Paenibacillus illinoisensis]|uniref:non-ribosomal peptide synthetase n=1 Tax=Paenibacillus illinoisensis TaxID=59845 RepID=UPI003015C069
MVTINIDISKLNRKQRQILEGLLQSKVSEYKGEKKRIPKRVKREKLDLSFSQKRLWFLQKLEPQSPFYNSPVCLRLKGKLNVEALRKTLECIVQRHEILRTSYYTVEGEPYQQINIVQKFELPLVDLSHIVEREKEKQAQLSARAIIRTVFDLENEISIRASVIKLNETEHVLVIVIHHIAWDGQSSGIFFWELEEVYNSLTALEDIHLPDIIQYSDYSLWFNEQMNDIDLEKQLVYWRRQLDGAELLTSIPLDYSRPVISKYTGGYIDLTIPSDVAQNVKELSRKMHTTPFIVLLSAFQYLLYRYSGKSDVITGTPISGRTHSDLENVIGFFVNSLAIRTKINGSNNFLELIAYVKSIVLDAYDHQDIPFEKVVEDLKIDRNLSYSPIFQVMFQYNATSKQKVSLKGLDSEPFIVEKGTTQFDLSLYLTEESESITGWLEYSTELFKSDTAERFMKYFLHFLSELTANPEICIDDLSFYPADEQGEMLYRWGAKEEQYSSVSTLHKLVEIQANQFPSFIAVEADAKKITYKELNQKANQIARFLIKNNIHNEDIVGLVMERTTDTIILLLAILKAGCVCLPIDPEYPQERILYMLKDSGAKLLLSFSNSQTDLSEANIPYVCLLDNMACVHELDEGNLDMNMVSSRLAYILYTSGSTGLPKGVMLPHKGFVNYIESILKVTNVRQGERVLQFQSLSFDAAIEEIFMTLSHGATLVMRTIDMLEPRKFVKSCIEKDIHVLDLPTAYWHELVSGNHFRELVDNSRVRLVIIGGEEALAGQLQRWKEQIGDQVQLINIYGPTENSISSTFSDLTGSVKNDGPVLIGEAIPNTQFYVLDEKLRIVPVGTPGELYLAGQGIARGYLNRPELTAEKFIPDPYSRANGSIMYKTGDLVCSLPDGNLYFLGRIDQQVKLRGFRIEIGEIESVLSECPGISEAAVTLNKDKNRNDYLSAYIVLSQEKPDITPRFIQSFISERLPGYMIPSIYHFIKQIPRTPNGKIDRLTIRDKEECYSPESELKPEYSKLEGIIAKVWMDLLGTTTDIDLNQSFFELGGHSLLAIKMIVTLEEILGVEIPLTLIFNSSQLREFAALVDNEHQANQI